MTDIEQASVTEMIAGKTRGSVVSALLSNFDIARSTLDTATNKSDGSAEKELENYQKGIEYSIDKFKATLQDISTDLLDSDFIKGAVDSATALLDVLDKIVSTLNNISSIGGNLNSTFGTLGAMLGIGTYARGMGLVKYDNKNGFSSIFSKSKIVPKLPGNADEVNNNANNAANGMDVVTSSAENSTDALEGWTEGLADAADGASALSETLSDTDGIVTNVASSTNQATTQIGMVGNVLQNSSGMLDGFGAALKTIGGNLLMMGANAAIMWGLSVAIGAVGTAIYNVVNAEEIAIEKGKKAADQISKITGDYENTKSTVDGVKNEYATLSKGVDLNTGKNESLSTEDYERFLSISNQLADIFPQLVTGYDSQGNAMLDLSGSADEVTASLDELLKKEQEIANFKIGEQMNDFMSGTMTEINNLTDQYNEAKKTNENAVKFLNVADGSSEDPLGLEDIGLKKQSDGTYGLTLSVDPSSDDSLDTFDLNTDALNNAIESAKKVDKNFFVDSYEASPNNFVYTFGSMGEEASNAFVEGFNSALAGASDGIVSDMKDAVTESSIDMSSTQKDIAAKWSSAANSIVSTLSLYDVYKDASEGLKDQFSKIVHETDPTQLLEDYSNSEAAKTGDWTRFLRETFLDPIDDLSPEMEKAINDFFDLDTSKLTGKDYRTQRDTIYDSLVKEFDGDNAKALDFMIKYNLIPVNEDGEAILDPYNEIRNKLYKKTGQRRDSDIDSLTIDQAIELNTKIDDAGSGDDIGKIVSDYIFQNTNSSASTKKIHLQDLLLDVDGKDTDFASNIDKSISKINTLRTSINSFRKDGKDGLDVTDLLKQYPQLATDMDNLGTGLEKIEAKEYGNLIKSIFEQTGDIDWSERKDYMQQVITSMISNSDIDPNAIKDAVARTFMANHLDGTWISDVFDNIKPEPKSLYSILNDDVFSSQLSKNKQAVEALQTAKDTFAKGIFTDQDEQSLFNALPKEYLTNLMTAIDETGSLKEAIEQVFITADAETMDLFDGMISKYPELEQAITEYRDSYINSIHGKTGDTSLYSILNDDVISSNTSKSVSDIQALVTAQQSLKNGSTDASEAMYTLIGSLSDNGDALSKAMAETGDFDSAINQLLDSADASIMDAFNDSINELAQTNPQAAAMLRQYAQEMIEDAHEVEGATAELGGIEYSTAGLKAYKDATSSANEGDTYLGYVEAIKKAKELAKDGLVGTDEFKEAAKLISPNGMDDYANYLENIGKAERYLTEDSTGVNNFLNDMESIGLATKDANNNWTYNIKDMDAAAAQMGMTTEWMLAMFGRLGDYGFTNDYFDSIPDGVKHLSELNSELEIEEGKLADLKARKGQVDENGQTITDTVIKEQQTKVDRLKSSIETTQSLLDNLTKRTLEDTENEVSTAKDTINEYIDQLGQTNNESVKSVIQDQIQELSDKYHIKLVYENGEIIGVVEDGIEEGQQTADKQPIKITTQEKQTSGSPELPKQNVTEISTPTTSAGTVGFTGMIDKWDTSSIENPKVDAEAEIVEVTGADGEQVEIGAKVVPTEYEEAPDTTMEVNTEINDDEVQNYKAPEKEAKVKYSVNPDAVNNWSAPNKSAEVSYTPNLTGLPDNNSPSLNRTATITYTKVGDDGATATGTATLANGSTKIRSYADGSLYTSYRHSMNAYANGSWSDWGLPNDQVALVNEEGNESIVRDGKWSILKGGAHFQSLKKGDIVFSKEQTDSLIKYGKINGHGKTIGMTAHANGTAYNMLNIPAYGRSSNPANSGGGNFVGGATSTPPNNPGTKQLKQSIDKAGKGTQKAAKAASDKISDGLQKILDELAKYKDWIEVKLDRDQRAADLNDINSQLAVGYTGKNVFLSEEDKNYQTLIKDNEKGSKRYEKRANFVAKQVGLPKKLYDRVKNGTIDIQKLSTDDKARVDAVSEWWTKVLDTKKATVELKQKLIELDQTKLSNITDQFEATIASIKNTLDLIDTLISGADAKGRKNSTTFYNAGIVYTTQNRDELIAERDVKQKQLNNSKNIKKGSLEWKQAQNEIDALNVSIEEQNNKIIELNNNIRQVEWNKFDDGIKAIDRLNQEATFMVDILSRDDDLFDDQGYTTNTGRSTLALYAQNYEADAEKLRRTNDEIARLRNEIESNPDNALDSNMHERLNTLIDDSRNLAKSMEDSKDSIQSFIKDGIAKQVEALNKLISKTKEALSSQKDLYSYSSDQQKKQAEISKLEKQLAVRQGDTSEEGQARTAKLMSDIEEKRKDLEESQQDHMIDSINNALDKLSTDYEEALTDKAKNRDALLKEVIQTSNNNKDTIKKTLEDEASHVGTTLSEKMNSIWGSEAPLSKVVNAALSSDGKTGIQGQLATIIEEIGKLYTGADKKAQDNLNQYGIQTGAQSNTAGSEQTNANILTSLQAFGTKHKKSVSSAEKKKHNALWEYIVKNYGYAPSNKAYNQIAKLLGVSGKVTGKSKDKASDASTKKEILAALKNLNGYAVGKRKTSDEMAWIGENSSEYVIRKSDGAILQKLNAGDSVLTAAQVDNIYKMSKDPAEYFKSFTKPNMNVEGMTGNYDISMTVNNNFDLKNVTNPQEFMNYMQNNKTFEKMLQDMTLGAVSNNNRLAKYRHSF